MGRLRARGHDRGALLDEEPFREAEHLVGVVGEPLPSGGVRLDHGEKLSLVHQVLSFSAVPSNSVLMAAASAGVSLSVRTASANTSGRAASCRRGAVRRGGVHCLGLARTRAVGLWGSRTP